MHTILATADVLIEIIEGGADEDQINVADYITDRLDREGFARKTLLNRDLKKGEQGWMKIPKKWYPRDKYRQPSEFQIVNTIGIDNMELAQSPGLKKAVADQIYESILVQEDRLWKKLADESPSRPFTNFQEMKTALGKEIPPSQWILGSKAWSKFVVGADLDPVSKRELVQTGKILKYLGLPIHTDFHREPNVKVLDENDIYLVGEPKYVGVRQVRKPLEVLEGPHPLGKPETVFNYNTIQSITLANPNGVVRRQIS